MEKVVINKVENIDNKIFLDNRKKLTVTGVTKVNSYNDSAVFMQIKSTKLTITGNNLTIDKLDIDKGEVIVDGTIDSIKYGSKIPFLKRIFK